MNMVSGDDSILTAANIHKQWQENINNTKQTKNKKHNKCDAEKETQKGIVR
jgi:hypothetical protein